MIRPVLGFIALALFSPARGVRPNTTDHANSSYISRLYLVLEESLSRLGVTNETNEDLAPRLERMACFIHQSMQVPSRKYHSTQHVFDVIGDLDEDDPIAKISALFHDCVYYHVDGDLSDLQYKKLNNTVSLQQFSDPSKAFYQVREENDCADDKLLCMVEQIFGYSSGQQVTFQNGLNEFFSAVIAVRELEPLLPRGVLAEVAVCIEATIPFRQRNTETGKSCMDDLHSNLVRANGKFNIGLSHADVVAAVQRAAILANADIANFGYDEHLPFLDKTLALLPELEKALRNEDIYTVGDFQFAIFKMFRFFGTLQPSQIFPHFNDVPASFRTRQAKAERNLKLGRKYLGARLLSLSVLSAIAEVTGGDAPISMFLGDLHSRRKSIPIRPQGVSNNTTDRIFSSQIVAERLFNEFSLDGNGVTALDSTSSPRLYDQDVFKVLLEGRQSELSFDARQSPFSATFYRFIGDEELESIFQDLSVYPISQDLAWKLLRRVPQWILKAWIQQLSNTATTRSARISRILDEL